MTHSIRRATVDDAMAIGHVHAHAWKWSYDGLMPQDLLDGIDPVDRAAGWRQAFDDDVFVPPYVAVDDTSGNIAGFVSMSASRDSDARSTVGEVTAIYIDRTALGTGLGSRLWHTALTWLRMAGHDEVTVWVLESNERGRAFYERVGLAPDGVRKVEQRGDHILDEVRYRAPIIAISTILCDIDGVIRRWEPMEPIEAAHGAEAGVLARTAFAPELLEAAVTGACTDEQWRERIADRLSETIAPDVAQNLVARWSEPSGTLDADVVAWLDRARAGGRRVFLVTNATTRLDRDLARIGLLEHVDGVVNSSAIGVAKPDPAYYSTALEIADAAPAQCLFIDDLQPNVDAAIAAGITGIHFIDATSLPDLD